MMRETFNATPRRAAWARLAGPCVVFVLAMGACYQCASASGDTFWGMVAVVASFAGLLWTCFATAGLYDA